MRGTLAAGGMSPERATWRAAPPAPRHGVHRLLVALALWLAAACGARAFVAEEVRDFPAPGAEAGVVSILSTTDTELLEPVILAFQARHPTLAVRYTVASSQEVYAAIAADGLPFDLAISSAMDLQMKLANDGFAAPYASAETAALPGWARWQDRLFAFAQEPVVVIVSRRGLAGLPVPETRRELIEALRDRPEIFRGRIGTYDARTSGAGYLFATQDARQSDSFWRLAEVMGGLAPRLYSSSARMIADLREGRLILAYNVLGSYATPLLAGSEDGEVVELQDYTLTLLRTCLVPKGAARPELGGLFVDFLLGRDGRALLRSKTGLPPIDEEALATASHLRPIRLDPGLLVYLDALKRHAFLSEWASAMTQP